MAGKVRTLFVRVIVIAIIAVMVAVGLALFRVGAPASIRIEPAMPGIGQRTPIAVSVEEPGRGLGTVRVELIQEQRRHLLAERVYQPREFWAFWGPRVTSDVIEVEAGRPA